MSQGEAYTISASFEGVRLDKVLLEILPESGLRLRRRLCDEGAVLVDGRERKPGFKVRAGQEVLIYQRENGVSDKELGLSVIKQTGLLAAIFKPGCVHSAAIQGKDNTCAELRLDEMFPDAAPIMLNRLDFLTSGLLLVALNGDGERLYRGQEAQGDVKKFYVAKVKGRLDGMVTVKNILDTDDRKKTRVLEDETMDERRWTDVSVLSHDHETDTTMVRCLIMKGARHQIRAHLASLGHPIVGDPLYGDGADGDVMHLHHQRIELPGFTAEAPISWANEEIG